MGYDWTDYIDKDELLEDTISKVEEEQKEKLNDIQIEIDEIKTKL